MEKRKLGTSGLKVAPLAFGGNVFAWTVEGRKAFQLLDAFVDAGFNLIDTADIYPRWAPGNRGGESEALIGRWLKRSGKRDKVLVATKVGKPMGPNQGGLSKAWILKAAHASLKRLRTDRIDLYQAHEDDPRTPLDETMGAFEVLLKAGKVRAVGASNYSAKRLAGALRTSRDKGLPAYQSLQPLYNLCERAAYEKNLEAVCLAEGLGVLPYAALAGGFLTGKYRLEADLSQSVRGGGVREYLTSARGMRILTALDDVARKLGATPAAVALAWLMARPGIIAPIVSATSLDQFRQLVAAAELKLDRDSIQSLNIASA